MREETNDRFKKKMREALREATTLIQDPEQFAHFLEYSQKQAYEKGLYRGVVFGVLAGILITNLTLKT